MVSEGLQRSVDVFSIRPSSHHVRSVKDVTIKHIGNRTCPHEIVDTAFFLDGMNRPRQRTCLPGAHLRFETEGVFEESRRIRELNVGTNAKAKSDGVG